MDGWMDRWMVGWMVGWMDGRTYKQADRYTAMLFFHLCMNSVHIPLHDTPFTQYLSVILQNMPLQLFKQYQERQETLQVMICCFSTFTVQFEVNVL